MTESIEQSAAKERDTQPTYVDLIRHVQTPRNLSGQLQGTENGEMNHILVERIPSHFSSLGIENLIKPDLIISSDLARAVETGIAVQEYRGWTDVHTAIDPRFRERNFGEYEGLTTEQILDKFLQIPWLVAKYPDLANLRGHDVFTIFDIEDIHPEGGETRDEVAARMREGILDLRDRYPGQRILVVSHGGAISSLKLNNRETSHLKVTKSSEGVNAFELILPQ